MTATDFEVRIVLEAQEFAEALSWHDRRRKRFRSRRHRNLAVDTYSETRPTGRAVHAALLAARTRGRARRRHNVNGLGKTDTEHGNDDALDGVDAVIADPITSSDDGFLVPDKMAQKATLVTGIPGHRNARRHVAVVHVKDITATGFRDGNVGKSWIVDLTNERIGAALT